MHFKTVLAHLKSKIFSVGQPWWPTFFHTETCWTHIFVLGPPLIHHNYSLYNCTNIAFLKHKITNKVATINGLFHTYLIFLEKWIKNSWISFVSLPAMAILLSLSEYIKRFSLLFVDDINVGFIVRSIFHSPNVLISFVISR